MYLEDWFMKTTSLRKALTYLESVSQNDDLVIILRISQGKKAITFHCTPHQALNFLFCSINKFKWMIIE